MIANLIVLLVAFLVIIVLMFQTTRIVMEIYVEVDKLDEDRKELYKILKKMEEDAKMISIVPTVEDYIEAYETYGETVVINDGKVVCTVEEK